MNGCNSEEHEEVYYILCVDRNMWWGDNSNGYTQSLSKAGKYTKCDAEKICDNVNFKNKAPDAVMMPKSLASEYASRNMRKRRRK
jgi:hypothetical protein